MLSGQPLLLQQGNMHLGSTGFREPVFKSHNLTTLSKESIGYPLQEVAREHTSVTSAMKEAEAGRF